MNVLFGIVSFVLVAALVAPPVYSRFSEEGRMLHQLHLAIEADSSYCSGPTDGLRMTPGQRQIKEALRSNAKSHIQRMISYYGDRGRKVPRYDDRVDGRLVFSNELYEIKIPWEDFDLSIEVSRLVAGK